MVVAVVVYARQHFALLLSGDIIEVDALQRSMQLLCGVDASVGLATATSDGTSLTRNWSYLWLDIQSTANNIKALHGH